MNSSDGSFFNPFKTLAVRALSDIKHWGCALVFYIQWCQVTKKFTSLLYLSTIFEKWACNKVNFFWSTFTWNEVRSISLLSNFCLILRDLFLF